MPQIRLNLTATSFGTFFYISCGKTCGRHYINKTVGGFTKMSTKVCFVVTSNHNTRSENSKTLSVGKDLENCIFIDRSVEFIKLRKLSKSSLECSRKKTHHYKNTSNIYSWYVTQSFKIVGVHGTATV